MAKRKVSPEKKAKVDAAMSRALSNVYQIRRAGSIPTQVFLAPGEVSRRSDKMAKARSFMLEKAKLAESAPHRKAKYVKVREVRDGSKA